MRVRVTRPNRSQVVCRDGCWHNIMDKEIRKDSSSEERKENNLSWPLDQRRVFKWEERHDPWFKSLFFPEWMEGGVSRWE
jgi:hypothetical protein